MITFSENKMNTPLVSVIIPNYCHAKYLDQRIQSVLNQTYQNFEVIILDDCSPDDGASRAVIEKYRDNPHVSHIIYNTENSGSPYKQWAKGSNLAKGQLLWIAESDDYADLRFLEYLVPQFKRGENVSVTFCRSIEFDENGIIGPAYPFDIEECVYEGRDFIRKWCILKAGIVNASSAIFRKKSFYEISDIYTTFQGAADKLFWVEIAETGNVAFIEKPYNYFRQHATSTTKRIKKTGLNSIEDKRIFDYLCAHNHIKSEEIFYTKYEYLKHSVFEGYRDKRIQQKIYKAWGWGTHLQVYMKFKVWIDKVICICKGQKK